MTFAAPWALLGLLALPLVWWLHKKLRRPPAVELPSLIFVEDETEARSLPRGRRLDAELLLALAATALLALAAADWTFVSGQSRRVVRVVVSGGAPAELPGYRTRVQAAIDDIEAGLHGSDDLELLWEPPARPKDSWPARRPGNDALLSLARAGDASLRIVISDRPVPAGAADVAWISIGDATAENQGIAAVSVAAADQGVRMFCNVVNAAPVKRRVLVRVTGGTSPVFRASVPISIEPGAMASVDVALSRMRSPPHRVTITLRDPTDDARPLRDALAADNTVYLSRAPLEVYIAAALPHPLRKRIQIGLRAVLGDGGIEPSSPLSAALAFFPRNQALGEVPVHVEFEPVVEGRPAERAGPGVDPLGRDPIVKDLSGAGAEWVYAEGAAKIGEDEDVLLLRRGERTWPLVLRKGRRIRLAPDPMRGEPRPADTPFWPLFIENLVEAAGGRGIGAGYRAKGLLDAASSRPGRAVAAFDPARLAGVRPSTPRRTWSLRPILIIGALACLGLLWAAPRVRRRLAARPPRGAKAHGAHA